MEIKRTINNEKEIIKKRKRIENDNNIENSEPLEYLEPLEHLESSEIEKKQTKNENNENEENKEDYSEEKKSQNDDYNYKYNFEDDNNYTDTDNDDDEFDIDLDFEQFDTCLDLFTLVEQRIIDGCDIRTATKSIEFVNAILEHQKFHHEIFSNCGLFLTSLYTSSFTESDDIDFLLALVCFTRHLFLYLSFSVVEQTKTIEQDCVICKQSHLFAKYHVIKNLIEGTSFEDIWVSMIWKCSTILSDCLNYELLIGTWILCFNMLVFVIFLECPVLQSKLGNYWLLHWDFETCVGRTGIPLLQKIKNSQNDQDNYDIKTSELISESNLEGDFMYILLYQNELAKLSGIECLLITLTCYVRLIFELDQITNYKENVGRLTYCCLKWICDNSSSFSQSTSKVKRSYTIYHLSLIQKVNIYDCLLSCNFFLDFNSTDPTQEILPIYHYYEENFTIFVNDIYETLYHLLLLNYDKILTGNLFKDDQKISKYLLTMIEVASMTTVTIMKTIIKIFNDCENSATIILNKVNEWFTPTYQNVFLNLKEVQGYISVHHKEYYSKSRLKTLLMVNDALKKKLDELRVESSPDS